MSIEAMAMVLHHSRMKGSAKLLLLGIANHEGDGGAFPSVATLAKYTGTTPRYVNRLMVELQEAGELEIDPRSLRGWKVSTASESRLRTDVGPRFDSEQLH